MTISSVFSRHLLAENIASRDGCVLLIMALPKKNSVFTIFLSAPNAPPPRRKNEKSNFIVVSPSLIKKLRKKAGKTGGRKVTRT